MEVRLALEVTAPATTIAALLAPISHAPTTVRITTTAVAARLTPAKAEKPVPTTLS